MGRLEIDGDTVGLCLNPLEKLLDLHWSTVRVPLSAVQDVSVLKPYPDLVTNEISSGFAGDTAPNRVMLSLKTRARARRGGLASVAVYLNRRAVVVHLAVNPTPWRLIIVSERHPDEVAARLQAAVK